ncbi:MAG: ADP-ribosylglycohydrolase family protein, partial [Lachnospiraceae bacterium]|nr:ADP-ribosylglycohydrolase family protein [Lachnospiraceae bacterium]
DSTGAVTGNIAGALVGYEGIDEKWKRQLEFHKLLLELADDLCYGCPMSEYSEDVDENWASKYVAGRKRLIK